MYLLRALAMPLQLASLLFVGLLAVAFRLATLAIGELPYLWILPVCFLLYWLAKYGYALLEQAADGNPRAPVVTVELLGPFEGRGPGVQLLAGYLAYRLAAWLGGWPATAVAGGVLALLPASVAALGASHRLRDAINPLVLGRIIAGLGAYYPLILVLIAAEVAIAYLLHGVSLPPLLRDAVLALLLLSSFSVIGGAIYERRLALGFEPRSSPERRAESARRERERARQRLLDDVYEPLRAGNHRVAQAVLTRYLESCGTDDLAIEVPIIMAQAVRWQDERGLAEVTRTLVEHLIGRSQLSLALPPLAAAFERLPAFALASQQHTLLLARHARSSGRPALAATLLERFARANPGRHQGAARDPSITP